MNKPQDTELVDASLSVESGATKANISFEGDYPLQINSHLVMAASERDDIRFICSTCRKKIETSETLWRSVPASQRREAFEYVVGHFVEENCDEPTNLNDIVDSVMEEYIGEPLHTDVMYNIERELTYELTGYG